MAATQLAEAGEERPVTEENNIEPNNQPTQSGARMSQGLNGVRERARKNKQERFTALLHHVTTGLLRDSFYALKRRAAPGVDGVTWKEYESGLEERLKDLHGRIHRGAYRAQPSKRVYIPKANGQPRPLGIAALEDKIVQSAVVSVLNQIYEEDFRGFSYGFRPGRSQHGALDALYMGIRGRKVNWILDLDLKSFFDTIDREQLVKLIGIRIADPRILRLIQKWLNAGIIEEGDWSETEKGTPQGAVISPLLANIYLHYVLDQWTDEWRRKAQGDVIIVRYADDAVIGFQHEQEAERFLENLREHLGQYGLELNEEKTRLIRFGRFARQNREERGEGKPESFTFLGFRHVCTENSLGRFEVRRITDGERRRKKLRELKQQLRRRMHAPVAQTGEWLRSVLNGYYQYHAVPGNLTALKRFRRQVARYWFHALGQRSQRRPTWAKLGRLFDHWLPQPHVVHPFPDARFRASRLVAAYPK
jgi:group II intron reverse transcriptase/maturase